MAVDASGATFAPIFKGQTSADPEELVDLAVAGARSILNTSCLTAGVGKTRSPAHG